MEQWIKCYGFMEGWSRNAGSGNRGDRATPDTEQENDVHIQQAANSALRKVHTRWKVSTAS